MTTNLKQRKPMQPHLDQAMDVFLGLAERGLASYLNGGGELDGYLRDEITVLWLRAMHCALAIEEIKRDPEYISAKKAGLV